MWYYIHTQIAVCTLECSIWCIMLPTHLSVHLKLNKKKGSNQNTYTAFEWLCGPNYLFIYHVTCLHCPDTTCPEHQTHFNPFTAGHKQLETRPEKIPPNNVMCLPSVWSTITPKHKDNKSETCGKIQPWIIVALLIYFPQGLKACTTWTSANFTSMSR